MTYSYEADASLMLRNAGRATESRARPDLRGLDNPFWSCLTTRHAHISRGGALARRYPADISPLAGLPAGGPANVAALTSGPTGGAVPNH